MSAVLANEKVHNFSAPAAPPAAARAMDEAEAARRIQRWWRSQCDRQLFARLKEAIFAAVGSPKGMCVARVWGLLLLVGPVLAARHPRACARPALSGMHRCVCAQLLIVGREASVSVRFVFLARLLLHPPTSISLPPYISLNSSPTPSHCAQEDNLASDILRQLCPTEAELLRDPALSGVVRLRFGGPSFPPAIYFKVFVSSKGCKVKYISGRRTIHAHSEVSFFLLRPAMSTLPCARQALCVVDGNERHPSATNSIRLHPCLGG